MREKRIVQGLNWFMRGLFFQGMFNSERGDPFIWMIKMD